MGPSSDTGGLSLPLQALNRNEDMKVSSEEIAYTASAETVRRGEIKAVLGNRRANGEGEAARGVQHIIGVCT